nr:hypothetical protein [Streptomonospora nanhaiensis]
MVGVLVVVALITYACTRASSEENGGTAGGGGEPSAAPEESPSPSVSPPASSSASPSASPSASEDPEGGGSGGAAGGAGSGAGDSGDDSGGGSEGGGSGGGSVAVPVRAEDPCRPSDIVVTMEVNKSDHDWNDRPKFELTLVNTAEQTCTVDTGRKAMEIRITSGEDRVFSTADCVEGSGADRQQLRRGVPYTTTFTWDRKRSWEDCRDSDVNAKRPGTYVAELHSDYDEGAEPQVFRLN